MKNNRQFAEDRLVIATHNKGKLREIRALFDGFGFRVISAGSLGLAEPEETETSFRGNAILKARAASSAAKLPALADDSGLVVAALDGAPGIFSARWAGPNKSFDHAMTKIEKLLKDKQNKNAYFVCALALVTKNKKSFCFTGTVKGKISFPPKGTNGFGYDPIFIPNGYKITFGQMLFSRKSKIDHRYKAFRKIKKFF